MEVQKEFLRAKVRIGGAKNPVNYPSKQPAFHKDDVPTFKREIADDTRRYKSSKLLSVDQPGWNNQSAIDRPVLERPTYIHHDHDRGGAYIYNYRAEVLPEKQLPPLDKPTKFHMSRQLESTFSEIQERRANDPIQRGFFPRTTEMPTHPILELKESWNTSTLPAKAELEKSMKKFTDLSLDSSKKWSTKLVETKLYVDPIKQTKNKLEQVRKWKRNGQFAGNFSDTLKNLETKKFLADKDNFKNRYALEPSRKYTTRMHSGRWEFNKMEKKYMWSDTGSFELESAGDIIRSHNPDAFNFAGPTLAPTTLNVTRRINLIEKKRNNKSA